MAYLAACTNAGTRKRVNEDACCLEVAQTPLGEVLMAIVCDGVGGLAKGDVASSTVINRFVQWFESELPMLIEGMVQQEAFNFSLVEAVWVTHLQALNELIRNYGAQAGARLGTTFTGIIACGGHYLVGHVGDCRAFRMNKGAFEQLTQDQTLVAKRLAAGEITEEEARRQPKNVILQSVGTERVVKPVFYEGSFKSDDLFVICCDGAYHQAENEGIRKLFQGLDYCDETALREACQTLLQFDMDCGEKDNLTVVCFSGALAGAGEEPVAGAGPASAANVMDGDGASSVGATALDEDDLATMVESGDSSDEDRLATMVEPDGVSDEDDVATMVANDEAEEDDLATMVAGDTSDEDDLATMVEPEDEDDLATMVEPEDDAEDDLATMVESEDEDEDDLATMVEPEPESDEDDLATMVADDSDEDDLATMVADDDWDDDEDDDEDPFADIGFDLPTFGDDEDEDEDDGQPAWDDVEDEAPTMVADEDDDLPTMVEGDDA